MKELNDYLKATQNLAEYFANRYFGKDNDLWLVADDIVNVACIADYYFSVTDMVEFIKHKYTAKKMFEYYDYALDYRMQDKHKKGDFLINIENYKMLNK